MKSKYNCLSSKNSIICEILQFIKYDRIRNQSAAGGPYGPTRVSLK